VGWARYIKGEEGDDEVAKEKMVHSLVPFILDRVIKHLILQGWRKNNTHTHNQYLSNNLEKCTLTKSNFTPTNLEMVFAGGPVESFAL